MPASVVILTIFIVPSENTHRSAYNFKEKYRRSTSDLQLCMKLFKVWPDNKNAAQKEGWGLEVRGPMYENRVIINAKTSKVYNEKNVTDANSMMRHRVWKQKRRRY